MPRLLISVCCFALLVTVQAQNTLQSAKSATPQVSGKSPFGEEESSFERLRERQEWFNHIRQYPGTAIPDGARRRAINQFNRMRRAEKQNRAAIASRVGQSANITDSSAQWTQIGPQPSAGYWGISSGRATAVRVDPRNIQVAYLGTSGGGVWKTMDGGKTWNPLTDQQPSLAIGSLAIDPANPDTVYAGTGEEDFSGDSYYGEGILKSTDGGQSWTNITGPFAQAEIGAIAINPANSNVVLAGALAFTSHLPWGGALLRSTDGGSTWSVALSGMTDTILFDPVQANVAYAGLGGYGDSYSGIYKSSDGGQNWTKLTTGGLPTVATGRVGLAVDPTRAGVVYAAIADPISGATGAAGIYKTTDGGATWALLQRPSSSFSNCCTWYENGIAVDPANPNVVVAGGFGVARTLDGGATWSNITAGSDGVGIHPDQHAFAFSSDGTVLYDANDGGAWSITSPASASFVWNSLNSTLATITFYPGLGLDPNNSSTAMAGTQDNSVEGYSGNLAWSDIDGNCGDGSSASIDPSNPNTAYNYCIGTIYRSINSGPWTAAMSGIDPTDSGGWVAPLVMDPSTPATLYYGARHLYQTTDRAATWQQISPALDPKAPFNAIAVAPSNSNMVYAGTSSGHVFFTTNASAGTAAAWSDISAGIPQAVITHIAVDPQASATAYLTLGGFGIGHIWKTTNSGSSWSDISANLPDAPANDLLVDPDIAHTLFVAMDVGVFASVDGGKTWATLSEGLPQVVVQSIGLVRSSRILRAITHGRSAWDLLVPIVPMVSSASSLNFPDQIYLSASAPLAFSLTNNSKDSIDQITISTTGDFSQTNTCGSSLAGSASCSVNVVFTPSTAGARAGTITVVSSVSPAIVVNLQGKGVATFSVSPSSASATVHAGQAATYNLTVAPLGGAFTGTIAFQCSGLPSESSCLFTPTSIVPGASPATVTVQVTTTAPSAMVHSFWNQDWQMLAALLLFPLGLLSASRQKRYKKGNAGVHFGALPLFGLLMIAMLSCGGGNNSSTNTPPPNLGTPAATYTLVVTGTAGSQSITTKLSLTVQ